MASPVVSGVEMAQFGWEEEEEEEWLDAKCEAIVCCSAAICYTGGV